MLSDPGFVAASDRFVPVRFNAYEDDETAAVVQAVAGEVRNAGIYIGPPDASRFVPFREIAITTRGDYGAALRAYAAQFSPRTSAAPGPVPWLKSVYEALNVAHCDARPLVIVLPAASGLTPDQEATLRAFAASDAFTGKFHYVRVTQASDAAAVAGFDGQPGLYFVQPTDFGLKGTVLARLPLTADRAVLDAQAHTALTAFAQAHTPLPRDRHVATGRFWGIRWAEGVWSRQGTAIKPDWTRTE